MAGRCCMAEDSSDKFNYIYCAVLLVALGSTCWVVPFVMNSSFKSSTSWNNGDNMKTIRIQATCACPDYFTDAYVEYAHKVCGSAVERILNGVEDQVDSSPTPTPTPSQNSGSGFDRSAVKLPATIFNADGKAKSQDLFVGFRENRENLANEKITLKKTVTYTIPSFLFLLGVAFLLPKLFWSYLLSFGRMNISKTLEILSHGNETSLTYIKGVRIFVAKYLKSSSQMALSYIFVKIFYLIVAAGGVIFLSVYIRPDLDVSSDKSRMIRSKPFDDIKFCEYKIIKMQSVQNYQIQCYFRELKELNNNGTDSPALEMKRNQNSVEDLVSSYIAVVAVAREVLFFVAIINLVQLITWICRLLLCGPRSQMSMDQRLFYHFAHCHVDALAMARLIHDDDNDAHGSGGDQVSLKGLESL